MLPDGCTLIVKELFADQLILIGVWCRRDIFIALTPMTEDKSRKSQTACQ